MKQILVSIFCLFAFLATSFGQAAPDIIDLQIIYNNATTPPQYEVYMRSDNNVTPSIVGSSQITVVFPSTAADGVLANANITGVFPLDWGVNTTTFAPMANDTFDYYAVATAGAIYAPGITAGVDILLFTFTVDGDCIEGARLFDNLRDPLSSTMDGGLDFENNIALQTAGGPIEAYDYLYGDLEPDCLLPVELLSFDARKGIGQVDLTWVTTTEINNDFFEIQRSADGREFRPLGTIDGKGTTFSTSNYVFIDEAPLESNYYRLRQVDFDKTESYSDIRYIAFENEEGSEKKFDIFPNPFMNEITVDLGTLEYYQIELFNSAGQSIIKQSYVSGQTINLSNIPNGSYTIKVFDAIGNEILVETIIKANRS
jgi:hypothetical protein